MTDSFKEAAGPALAGPLIMMMLGFLGVFLPSLSTRVSSLLGWTMVVSGFTFFLYAFAAQADGELFSNADRFFYLFGGLYLLLSPKLELKPLTFLVAAIVLLESFLELTIFPGLRPLPASGWILLDGIATFILAYLIWHSWPSSSTQAIGSLIDIKFIVSGFSRLMYSTAAPRVRSCLLEFAQLGSKENTMNDITENALAKHL